MGVRNSQGARELLVSVALAAAGLVLAAAVTLGPHMVAQTRSPTVSVVDVTQPAGGPVPLP